MKRFHIHVSVDNLQKSINFYSKLFNQEPGKVRPDYARWMLDEPAVNFAISTRGQMPGVNHLGIQVDSDDELEDLKQQAVKAAGDDVIEETGTVCCYSKSNKYWTTDPQGIAWEHFITMSDAPTFDNSADDQSATCCVPLNDSDAGIKKQASACCVPAGNNDCCS